MENTREEPIRNVAIVSSVGAGKTSLCEALIYVAGVIPSMGSVTHGTTVSDFEPEELRHRTSTQYQPSSVQLESDHDQFHRSSWRARSSG